MGPEIYVDMLGDALLLVILLVCAIILPSLAVGLMVAIFQAATSINEQTLSFLPRLIVTLLALIIGGGGGDFHIALPYSMLEPIRELLDAGVQSDKEDTDMRWSKALRDEIMDVPVTINTKFIEVDIPLSQVMELQAGDIIPIEMPEHITVLIEDLPTYRAKLGRSRDNIALKIESKIKRPESAKSELTVLTKGGKRLDSDAELHLLEDDL